MTRVKITLEIDFAASVQNAVEQGIGYWAARESRQHADGHWSIIEQGNPHRYHLTLRSLRNALQIMAEKYPRLFARIVSEDTDADTDDALVQVACFGELKYG